MAKLERPYGTGDFEIAVADSLERIARAHEGMLAVAMEARGARMELSKKLQEKLQQPFEGK